MSDYMAKNNALTQIYLLTDNSVPFVQDGYIEREHIRDWMFSKFLEKLKFENKTFYLLYSLDHMKTVFNKHD
jgi:hypothetical protein